MRHRIAKILRALEFIFRTLMYSQAFIFTSVTACLITGMHRITVSTASFQGQFPGRPGALPISPWGFTGDDVVASFGAEYFLISMPIPHWLIGSAILFFLCYSFTHAIAAIYKWLDTTVRVSDISSERPSLNLETRRLENWGQLQIDAARAIIALSFVLLIGILASVALRDGQTIGSIQILGTAFIFVTVAMVAMVFGPEQAAKLFKASQSNKGEGPDNK